MKREGEEERKAKSEKREEREDEERTIGTSARS